MVDLLATMKIGASSKLRSPLLDISNEELFLDIAEEAQLPVEDPFRVDLENLPQRKRDKAIWVYGLMDDLSEIHLDDITAHFFGFEDEDQYLDRLMAQDDVESPEPAVKPAPLFLHTCESGAVVLMDEEDVERFFLGSTEVMELDIEESSPEEIHPLEKDLPCKQESYDVKNRSHHFKRRSKLNAGDEVRIGKRSRLHQPDPWKYFGDKVYTHRVYPKILVTC